MVCFRIGSLGKGMQEVYWENAGRGAPCMMVREAGRIREQCICNKDLSWSLGNSGPWGGLYSCSKLRQEGQIFIPYIVQLINLGCSQGETMTLGDAAFSSQQLGWALSATILWATGTMRVLLYLGSATHWLSQVLVLSEARVDQLCVTSRFPPPLLVLFLALWEKLLHAHFRHIQRLQVVIPHLNYNVQAREGMPCLSFLE